MVKFLLNPLNGTQRDVNHMQLKKKTGSCPYKTLHGGTNYECVPFCDQLTPTDGLYVTREKTGASSQNRVIVFITSI